MGTATLTVCALLTWPFGRDDDRAGGCTIGNAGDQECVGTDDDRSFDFAELDLRALQFWRPQAGAGDANFASGRAQCRGNRFNVRSAVDVLSCPECGRKCP